VALAFAGRPAVLPSASMPLVERHRQRMIFRKAEYKSSAFGFSEAKPFEPADEIDVSAHAIFRDAKRLNRANRVTNRD
jgi:hypothetical protein